MLIDSLTLINFTLVQIFTHVYASCLSIFTSYVLNFCSLSTNDNLFLWLLLISWKCFMHWGGRQRDWKRLLIFSGLLHFRRVGAGGMAAGDYVQWKRLRKFPGILNFWGAGGRRLRRVRATSQISRNSSFLRGGGTPGRVGATWLISKNSSFQRGGTP